MRILESNFKLLTMCGCWRPDSWLSMHKRIAYYVHTSIIALLLHTFLLSQLMNIILTFDNADDFIDNIFLLIISFFSCCKLFIFLMNRENIIMLINILKEKPCKPSKSTEIDILYKFDKSIQINSWRLVYLGAATVSCIVFSSLSTSFRNGKLTYKAWLPFDYSSTLLFCLAYIHQLLTFVVAAFLNIGCDTFMFGLLIHICCQIDILTYRLRKIISYSGVLSDCVRQHYHIFRLVFIVNAKFGFIFAIQFMVASLVICCSLYQISTATTNAKYLEMVLYISCVLADIFCYCWFGNELKIKSHQMVDDIFEMEWLTLDENRKKSLMIIMRRAIVPIQITCVHTIPMNLNTFMGILKMSYSTFNLLQNVQMQK